ncbi:CoA-acylating methylmalonate-semialdehyde dehydrogenase [Spiroplasma alleghenense]|uniref:methylmalonate-semialdehyde dehydrogenase (CoA acylating) n=1 Tax=Spiroplasma alleghenense TaxID=216931 RepID=A0A345Z3G0_9MOLU|nr:CoA-acylating methylmalonate-semialdehyde dehydrogenase [Spiroplasma alleghenense]AXK51139.1 malonate-semialdehyde dehydrogenase (acetylating) / methylmalonate-semialdehyde dehydrogenase [Spiroplasma alleghenense]
MKEYVIVDNYINGNWVKNKSENYLDLINPATKEKIGKVALSNNEDLKHVVESSKSAFKIWSKFSTPKRVNILINFLQLVKDNKKQLAEIITIENGKPIAESIGEVQRGVESIQHAISVMTLSMGDSLGNIATGVEATSYNYPIGIVAGICPFNFPMMVPCWMFPLAIALGNCFILKPSEKTPQLAKRLAEIFNQAGLPDGVFNILNGGKDAVNAILQNSDIQGISFVGSKKVGEYIYQEGSKNFKRVQSLTGAKNHAIILKDANIDHAVDQILKSAFGSAGERCMACSVVVIEKEIADEFCDKLKNAALEIKIGNGLDENNNLGPVISQESLNNILNYIDFGIKEKAKLILDGRKVIDDSGYFIGPTIFDQVTTEMKIWKDEIFGPLLSIVRVSSLEAAIRISNESQFGNGACLFTDSASAIRTFRENIDAGMLGINLGVPAPIASFPFSGWKDSFYGTSHTNGKDGVAFYTRRKVVTALLNIGKTK